MNHSKHTLLVIAVCLVGHWTSFSHADDAQKAVQFRPWQQQGRRLWNTFQRNFTSPNAHKQNQFQYLVRMVRTDFGSTSTQLENIRNMVTEINSGSDIYNLATRKPQGSSRVVHASVVNQRSARPFMNSFYGIVIGTDGSHVCATSPCDMEVWGNHQLQNLSPKQLATSLYQRYGIRSPQEILSNTNTFQAADIRRGGGNNDITLFIPAHHDGSSLRTLAIVGFSRPEWRANTLYTPRNQEQFRKLADDLKLPFIHLLQLTGAEDPHDVDNIRP